MTHSPLNQGLSSALLTTAVLTDLGKTLLDDAYQSGHKLIITEMSLGDSNLSYVKPSPSFTCLVNEFGRQPINEGNTDDTWINAIVYVDATRWKGKEILEFGLHDADGNMIVYSSYPRTIIPADGSEYVQIEIECYLDLYNASSVSINITPIIPLASETEAGLAKIATKKNVDMGVDDSTIVTPKKLKEAISSSTGSSYKYIPVINGISVLPNQSYITGALNDSVIVDDSKVELGDFIKLASDYTKRSKSVSFNRPVVIGDELYIDGNITFNDKLDLWFDGVAWTNTFSSIAPLIDHGIFTFTNSQTIALADLEGIAKNQPLHVSVKICGGGALGGGSKKETTNLNYNYIYWFSGGGASTLKCDFVVLDDQELPLIKVGIGAKSTSHGHGGASSSLEIDQEVVCSAISGGVASANTVSPRPIVADESKFIHTELLGGGVGRNGWDHQGESGGAVIAEDGGHGGQPGYNRYNYPDSMSHSYYHGGGASAMSSGNNGFGHGGGYKYPAANGGCVITIRPATADEIAAQEALNS